MNKSNWITIVNKAAGGGKTEKAWPEIEYFLRKHGINFEVYFTDRRMHAAIIAKNKIKEGYSRIIVVGGDGTMNEVINGLFSQGVIQTTEVMLGMISVGTGNDWAKMFNIPTAYEEAVLTIKKQRTFLQDAGLVQYTKNGKVWNRYFINIAGLGFGARVVERSNRMKEKGKSSSTLYLYNIFTSLMGYKAQKADIRNGRKIIQAEHLFRECWNMQIRWWRYDPGTSRCGRRRTLLHHTHQKNRKTEFARQHEATL